MSEVKFQVGDIVEWCGVKGEIIEMLSIKDGYPIIVKFDEGGVWGFDLSGRYFDWHKEPSLKLIERPKKEVEYWIGTWIKDGHIKLSYYSFKCQHILKQTHGHKEGFQMHKIIRKE